MTGLFNCTRREFLMLSAMSSVAALLPSRTAAASDRVRVAVVGCGSRGSRHLSTLRLFDGDIAALVDNNSRAMDRAASQFAARGANAPDRYSDARFVLDREDVDVVVVAAAEGSCCEIALSAVDAGKDVVVELPVRDSGALEKISEAARLNGRIAQVTSGTQFAGGSNPAGVPHHFDFRRATIRLDCSKQQMTSGFAAAFPEVDFARGVLEANKLSGVAAIGMQGSDGGIVRAQARFAFGESGSERLLTLEVGRFRELEMRAPLTNGGARGLLTFSGSAGAVAFGSLPAAATASSADVASWAAMLDAVRTRNASSLPTPIDEAVLTMRALEMAASSLSSGAAARA